MRTDKEIETLLFEGYRCSYWGRRITYCTKDKCDVKDICIFMNGSPADYTNYVLTEYMIS